MKKTTGGISNIKRQGALFLACRKNTGEILNMKTTALFPPQPPGVLRIFPSVSKWHKYWPPGLFLATNDRRCVEYQNDRTPDFLFTEMDRRWGGSNEISFCLGLSPISLRGKRENRSAAKDVRRGPRSVVVLGASGECHGSPVSW